MKQSGSCTVVDMTGSDIDTYALLVVILDSDSTEHMKQPEMNILTCENNDKVKHPIREKGNCIQLSVDNLTNQIVGFTNPPYR